ncbi:hypothetical protein U1Q18_051850 [Sarracenia purpurea var. burkii]
MFRLSSGFSIVIRGFLTGVFAFRHVYFSRRVIIVCVYYVLQRGIGDEGVNEITPRDEMLIPADKGVVSFYYRANVNVRVFGIFHSVLGFDPRE